MSVYVIVSEGEEDTAHTMELPTEADQTILLSVLKSQFEGATGLKYRSPLSGLWRAVRISDSVLHPPNDGWGTNKYIVVTAKTDPEGSVSDGKEAEEKWREGARGYKRGHTNDGSEYDRPVKTNRSGSPPSYADMTQDDVIVLGLQWGVTEDDLKEYFEQFGKLVHAEVKKDRTTNQSRGFGFIRYADIHVQDKVLNMVHRLKGRRCELRQPRKSPTYIACKYFIGCLPNTPEVTTDDLKEHFSKYGPLSDVYVPRPYRGFGFVTYASGYDAQEMLKDPAVREYRGCQLNIAVAEPKKGTERPAGAGGGPFSQQPTTMYASSTGTYYIPVQASHNPPTSTGYYYATGNSNYGYGAGSEHNHYSGTPPAAAQPQPQQQYTPYSSSNSGYGQTTRGGGTHY